MKKFIISEYEIKKILQEISQAPAVHVFNAMNILGRLPVLNPNDTSVKEENQPKEIGK